MTKSVVEVLFLWLESRLAFHPGIQASTDRTWHPLLDLVLPLIQAFYVSQVGVEVQAVPEVEQPIVHVLKSRQLTVELGYLPLLLLLGAQSVHLSPDFICPPLDAFEGCVDLGISPLLPVIHEWREWTSTRKVRGLSCDTPLSST